MYSGFDLNNPFVVDALAGFRLRPPANPAAPSPFQDMPTMDALPGGVTEAPRPAASGSAPWGFIGEDQAREEISRKIQQIDAEKAAQERAIEQAKQAQAPATFWGMPVVSPEQAQYAAEQQYAETKAREKQAEAQLAGDAPLPTLTPERNFAETAYQSAGKSIANVPKFAGYIGGWLASEAGSDAAPTDNAVFGLGQNIEDWAKSSFPGDEARSEEFGTKAANLAGFLATLYGAGGLRAMTEGGPILAEKIGRAASLGSQASLAASGGAMGQFEGATAAMEQGGDVSERDRAISTLLGAGVGLTSMIPLASSLATPAEREAGAVMAEVLKGSGVTASQMAGYNVMSNAIAKTFYDPDRALTQGLGDDLALGALAGGVTHGVSSLAKPRMSTPEEIGAFINRARSASDPSSAAYFDGMRDWVNANVPRLPAPAEGGAPAPAGAEPSPKPAPSGGLKGQEPALKEWVNDVYGDGYRGEVSPDGKTLAIVGPEGKKLITYQPEDLRMSGALKDEPPTPGTPSETFSEKILAEKPVEPRLTEYRYEPMDVSQPTAGKVFYHGTKANISKLSDADVYGRSSFSNLYGEGLYLTDNPNVARSYSDTKGKGESGKVLAAKLKDVNLVDLEKPLPDNVFGVFLDNVNKLGGLYPEDEQRLREGAGKHVFGELQDAMRYEGLTGEDATEIYNDINYNLSRLGFDGFRHQGGDRTRRQNLGPHNVVILFEDDLWSPEVGQAGRLLRNKFEDEPYSFPPDEPEPRNVTESGPYSIRGNWREEAHANRQLSAGAGEGSQGEGAKDAAPHTQTEERRGEEGDARQRDRVGDEGVAYGKLDQVKGDVPDKFWFKNNNVNYATTATRVEPSYGRLGAVRFWANPEGVEPDLRGPAAKALLEQRPDGRWEVSWMDVRRNLRGDGRGAELIGNLYDAIERQYGIKMRPSGHLTPDGYRFWSGKASRPGRDPELVKYHQLVEDSDWHSPRYIKDEIDRLDRRIEDLDPIQDWEEIQTLQKEAKPWRVAFENVPEEGKTPEALEAQFALRGFYRPDMRAAENVRQEKATAQQWSAMLSKEPGAKRWLDLIGFGEWAGAQKGAIKKQDVLDFIRANDVEIEEFSLGDIDKDEAEKFREEVAEDLYGVPYSGLTFYEQIAVQTEMDKQLSRGYRATKYADYKIDGGEKYREILVRVPKLRETGWRSPHFRDYEVIHMRVDERTLPDGRRVLFLNELQSDLHQRGRERGYRPEDYEDRIEELTSKEYEEKLSEYEKKKLEWDARMQRLKEAGKKYDETLSTIDMWVGHNTTIKSKIMDLGSYAGDVKKYIGDLITSPDNDEMKIWDGLWGEVRKELLDKVPGEYIKDLQGSYNTYWENNIGMEPRKPDIEDIRWGVRDDFMRMPPDAPFKGDWWWEIGLKNLIRKAAEEGYDAVSIARSGQIEEKVGAEEGSLSVFYDQKMPRFLEKYVRKLGGYVSKNLIVGQMGYTPFTGMQSALMMLEEKPGDFGLSPEEGREAERMAELFHTETTPQQIIDAMSPGLRKAFNELFFDKRANTIYHITPEMREKILDEGQALARASDRELIEMARTLNAGKVVDVDPDIYGKIFADIQPIRQALPESTPVRALTKIEPREGGEGLILTFDDGAGNIARMTAGSIDDFAHLGGFCLADGSAISFVSLSLVGKAGDGGPGSGGEIGAGDTHGGVFLHEATHALFRQQRIPADDWVRFVDHAQNLRVMDMSMTDFMKAIGEEPQPGEATIRDAYEMLYQNKPMEERDVLINEEEAVAHMMQLFHLKHYDGEQMQPIVDILYKFISGGYSGRESNE